MNKITYKAIKILKYAHHVYFMCLKFWKYVKAANTITPMIPSHFSTDFEVVNVLLPDGKFVFNCFFYFNLLDNAITFLSIASRIEIFPSL